MRNNRDKDRAPKSMLLFGNGDGGGGPTVDMCESLRRLSGGVSGLPEMRVTGEARMVFGGDMLGGVWGLYVGCCLHVSRGGGLTVHK